MQPLLGLSALYFLIIIYSCTKEHADFQLCMSNLAMKTTLKLKYVSVCITVNELKVVFTHGSSCIQSIFFFFTYCKSENGDGGVDGLHFGS